MRSLGLLTATVYLPRLLLFLSLLSGCDCIHCDFFLKADGPHTAEYSVRDRRGRSVFGGPRGHDGMLPKTMFVPPQGAPAYCRPVVLVTSDTRKLRPASLEFGLHFNESLFAHVSQVNRLLESVRNSWVDTTFLINSGYAQLHGYGYVYIRVVPAKGTVRAPTWHKLPAIRMIANACPTSKIVFLDSDAYIRALTEPIVEDTSHIPEALAGAIDGAWLRATYYACLSMSRHESILRSGVWRKGMGVVNGGVLFFLHPEKIVPLIDAWWAVEAGKYDFRFAHEQKALEMLLAANSSWRSEVALLDPTLYNGPSGVFVRHYAGGGKKGNISADAQFMVESVLDRIARSGRQHQTAAAVIDSLVVNG
jgi:hypothetical protein